MKKILAFAAVLLVAAYSFADGFTNKVNVGGVYSNTDFSFEDDSFDYSLYGWGMNLGWRGTFSNGLTLLADLDILPNATFKVEDSDFDDDFLGASLALGVGYEWTFEKGCFSAAGVFGDSVFSYDKDGTSLDITTYFIGANLYGTYMFTKLVGLYGSCTAGISIGGTVKQDDGTKLDLEAGDFCFAPKFGVVFKF